MHAWILNAKLYFLDVTYVYIQHCIQNSYNIAFRIHTTLHSEFIRKVVTYVYIHCIQNSYNIAFRIVNIEFWMQSCYICILTLHSELLQHCIQLYTYNIAFSCIHTTLHSELLTLNSECKVVTYIYIQHCTCLCVCAIHTTLHSELLHTGVCKIIAHRATVS